MTVVIQPRAGGIVTGAADGCLAILSDPSILNNAVASAAVKMFADFDAGATVEPTVPPPMAAPVEDSDEEL